MCCLSLDIKYHFPIFSTTVKVSSITADNTMTNEVKNTILFHHNTKNPTPVIRYYIIFSTMYNMYKI